MSERINTSEMGNEDLRSVRKILHKTQRQMADLLGVSVQSLARWESSEETLPPLTALIVQQLFADPDLLNRISLPEQKLPLRLWYYYYNIPCTLIEADERNRIVRVTNYTNRIVYRAFGKITEPTYEDFEEFLESRCFPRTRDKQKLMLEALGLPYYDPLAIIEKTGGRIAEDNFRVVVERL